MTNATLNPFKPSGARPASSTPVFQALKDQYRKLGTQTVLTGPALARDMESPLISSYLSKLPTAPASTRSRAISAVEQVKQARADLLVHALAYPEVAKTIGLAFDDKNVIAGAQYRYALRVAFAPTVDLATVDITVGADPQPAAPSGLAALQRN